jgi:hypothetical protein
MAGHPAGRVAKRFERLSSERSPFIQQAHDSAKLTIPNIFPEATGRRTSRNQGRKNPTPWQSVGARGVNNLASKLLLALLPPNTPFFRYLVEERILEALNPEGRSQLVNRLGQIETGIVEDLEATAFRVHMFEALRHLIVTGNFLVHFPPKGSAKGFPLDRYVVKRDPEGSMVELVVHEELDFETLEARVKEIVERKLPKEDQKDRLPISLYTRVWREDGIFRTEQEALGETVPRSHGTYPLDVVPWLPLRFIAVEGDDYGHSFVSEYLGDLQSLETLRRALVEGSAAAARVLFLVKPGRSTNPRVLEEAPNLGIRVGDADDVTILRLEKAADFNVARQVAEEIKNDLSFAFLMNSAIQRNGERVTAEEIRTLAEELEDTLGGVYSLLSLELQLPLVKIKQNQMAKQGKIPRLSPKDVRPQIATGLDAIGRGHELQRLKLFEADIISASQVSPEVPQRIDWGAWLKRMATARGISVPDLFKSEQQLAQEAEATRQATVAATVGPEMARGAREVAVQSAKRGPQQQQQ